MITRKIIIICIVMLLGLFGIYGVSRFMSPGSHPNAEQYKIKVYEQSLITAIERLKKDEPQLTPPIGIQLQDHMYNDWHIVYWYFKEENILLYTYVTSG